MGRTVCFDLETELFGDAFRKAPDAATRLKHAPRMRLGCAFDGEAWHDFLPHGAATLIALLQGANTLISFNGLAFDELVLRRYHGLKGRFPRKGKHLDLYAELVREGRGASLDRLAKANLGEGKLVQGRSMADLDIEALKTACRSDVSQTWRLWEMWTAGTLKAAAGGPRQRPEAPDPYDVGPGHHAPETCPHCGDVGSLELIDMDVSDEEMTEGQATDYEAGLWGVSVCATCRRELDWGF